MMIHPKGAKILFIGEAWGKKEEEEGKPFVGQAGRVLDDLLDEAGLSRSMVAITNVMHERPPSNKFSTYYEKVGNKKQPTGKLQKAYARLQEEIAQVNPNVIVPLGNEPMKAILGYAGIQDYRGSILEHKGRKIIPTIHPAAVLRKWTDRPAVVCDFKRIAQESEYPDVRIKERMLKINPTFEEVINAIEEAKKQELCAFDIEVETEQVTCIGLSSRTGSAICIPFWWGGSGSLWSIEQEGRIWEALRVLLESKQPKKIAHNGLYDCEYLKRLYGINTNLGFDTMGAFHVVYPELPKSLAYLISIYTDHPFHKYGRKAITMDDAWKYNATDACLTLECYHHVYSELLESNLEQFYQDYVHALIDPLLSMQLRGVKFDCAARNEARKLLRKEIDESHKKLEREVGFALNPASGPQMVKWLYEDMKYKKVYRKRGDGKKTLTADDEALRQHYVKKPIPAIQLVLNIRKKSKILSTYLEVKLDEDKRIRCSYNLTGTETGRLSSSASARGTGTNLQNIPSGLVKDLFIADDGYSLIDVDLSQAEARVVAYIANEPRLIEVFDSGGDVHTKNASNIFNKKESEVTKDERQTAKRVVHASNYGMGPRTFARTAGIPVREAKGLLNRYFATYPRIKQWHLSMASQLKKTRVLYTPFGRRRIFFNKWSDSVLKEALAYVPQSTVADMVNQAIIKLHNDPTFKGELLMQVHDSIVCQARDEDVKEVCEHVCRVMSQPIQINGKILTIPSEAKVGKSWGGCS